MENNRLGVVSATDLMVSRNIKTKRIILGLSQQKVGKALGVSIQQIQKYESGKNRISSGNLYNLAEFFGVSVNYFFKTEANVLLDKENSINEKQIIYLMEAFNHIKNRQIQNKVIEMVRLMAKT